MDAILNQEKAVQLTDDGDPDKLHYLSSLGLSQQGHYEHFAIDDKHPDKPMYLSNLGNCQLLCYEGLSELADLKGSILNQQMAVKLTDDSNPDKPGYFNFGKSQAARYLSLREPTDIEGLSQIYKRWFN
jgi:hypothetical protein